MATIKFIFRSQKERAGEAPLYVRIYHNGKTRQKKTNIYLESKHWDEDNQRIRKSHPQSTKVQLDLDRWKLRAQQAVRNADPLTAQNIKHQLEGVNPDSYFEYVEKILPTYNYSDRNVISAATGHLKKMEPDLTLTGVDVTLLKQFEKKLMVDRGLSQNTASHYLGTVRRVLNRAINDELISPNDSPFSKKRISLTWEDTNPTPLSWEQFKKIRDVEAGDDLQLFKDMFLFSVYMDGMRLTDVLMFRPAYISDGKAVYTMSKTKKKKHIKITKPARDIIERYRGNTYLFPLLDPTLRGDNIKEEMNRIRRDIWGALKKLGKKAGLGIHLHFHMARNTSAYIAYKKGNWSIVEIQNMLQHSTINQTRDYLGKMAPEEIDSKRDELWGE